MVKLYRKMLSGKIIKEGGVAAAGVLPRVMKKPHGDPGAVFMSPKNQLKIG